MTAPAHAIHALLVEDDVDDALALQRALRGRPLHVTRVASAHDALQSLDKDDYKVFLVDHRLPDREGVALCRDLRQRSGDAVIILLSALAQDEVVRRAFQAGADHYFVKELEYSSSFVDSLMDFIEERLRGHRKDS